VLFRSSLIERAGEGDPRQFDAAIFGLHGLRINARRTAGRLLQSSGDQLNQV
jgi:hypothetical protein